MENCTLSKMPIQYRMPFILALALSVSLTGAELPEPFSGKVDFDTQIKPLKCFSCHGPKKQESSFRLDSKESLLKGGENGPAVVPGKSHESKLIHFVAGTGEIKMPKKGERLTGEQISVLRAWIDQGLPWPESATNKTINAKNHWAFKTPTRPRAPDSSLPAWRRNGFLLPRKQISSPFCGAFILI
jgi:hypothetical protein